MDGNLITRNGKGKSVSNTWAHNTQKYFRTFWTTQTLHNLFARHLDTSNSRIVHRDNAVTSQNTHLLRGSTIDGLDN